MARRTIFLGAILGAAVVVLLPSTAMAEFINIYPGPDAEWNYLYDFGDVEVGASGVMIFQIENDPTAPSWLIVDEVVLEDVSGPFTISQNPAYPAYIDAGDSVYVEVTFAPDAVGFFEGVMMVYSNASNDPPGAHIPYGLQGMGIAYEPPADELMTLVMDFYADALADGSIYGLGGGGASAGAHIRVFGNMLDAADDLIAAGDYEGACAQLDHAVVKSDGANSPPDFIGGPGVSSLNSMLLDVMSALGC